MSKYKDAITGSVSILIGIVLFILSFQVKDFASVSVGPEFLPRLAATLFVALGAILAFQGLRTGKVAAAAGGASAGKKAEGVSRKDGGLVSVGVSILLLVGYVALLDSLGFIVTSAIFIFFQIIILSKGLKRNYLLFAVVAALSAVVAYYLFVRVFQVMIPAGILG